MEVITKSAEETKSLGRKIAADLVIDHRPLAIKPLIFALTGDLGSGKTTFVQGFAQGLGIKTRIISPTFIIVRKYLLPVTSHSPSQRLSRAGGPSLVTSFYHIDLYRLEKDVEKEIINLGVDEIWNTPGNVVAIEWAEKIASVIPKEAVWIKFGTLGEEERRIQIND